jgi:carboxylate-amine ligase
MSDAYRFGIEEEFFLADAESRATPLPEALRAFHAEAAAALPSVSHELLASQVEVQTEPLADFAVARDRLAAARGRLAELARRHGLLVFASGTHPLAPWVAQPQTQSARHRKIVGELEMLASRTFVCALHVHVELPPQRRVDLLRRLVPFLPLFLALSVNSPFWQGRDTGLKGYRTSAMNEWPRTGLPDFFTDEKDYERYLRIMTATGAIDDASFVWWSLRPAARFPTLELRVCDACVDLDHVIALSALYRCLVRLLDRRPDLSDDFSGTIRAIAAQNIWQAQQSGIAAQLIDAQNEQALTVRAWLDRLGALVQEDADILGCGDALEKLNAIPLDGTGADFQHAVHERASQRGLDGIAAVNSVVDQLAVATAQGKIVPKMEARC